MSPVSPQLVSIQHRWFICSNPRESQKVCGIQPVWILAQGDRLLIPWAFPIEKIPSGQSMSKTRTRSTRPCQAEFPDYSEAHSFIPRDEAGKGIPMALEENSRENKGLTLTDSTLWNYRPIPSPMERRRKGNWEKPPSFLKSCCRFSWIKIKSWNCCWPRKESIWSCDVPEALVERKWENTMQRTGMSGWKEQECHHEGKRDDMTSWPCQPWLSFLHYSPFFPQKDGKI